ncbi:MAG: serine/threonine protein kinase [Phycisphaerales bacterium]|nr:serine/threonine protein kinase [Phycisphaerales bacterium]
MDHASGRLKALFHEASELLPSRRREFLDSACGSDTSLREDLETLLAARQEMGEYLAQPTIGAAHAGDRAGEYAPGSRIGPYTLLDLMGEGGFGVVYKAEQREPVRRTVALKIIKLGMDTRQVIARFEQERQALALMDHPNIARVLDAGATQAGRPYFVMDLVAGEPITHYCDAHRLTVKERLEVFAHLCHAVQHAHQKGIIHRDLKPSNILVTIADDKPVPKIIDFGIAKATGARLTDLTLVTEHRALIGTPEYMSPEQAEMGGVDIDTRTDIYSLGVLLYELLTGVTPFESKKLRSAAWDELQRIIRELEPPRPSTRLPANTQMLSEVGEKRDTPPARLTRLIRGDLDWIVMKAIEKDRSRRYETASALAADIQRHLAGEPVLAAPPGALYRAGKFLRRHRVQAVAGSLVAASLLAAVVGTTTFAVQARRRAQETERVADFQARMLSTIRVPGIGSRLREDLLHEAEEAWQRQRTTGAEIDQRRELLTALLADSNFTNTAIRDLDGNIFVPALAAIEQEFADQPLVKARLLQHLADACRSLSLLDRAGEAQTEALRIRAEILGKRHLDTATSLAGMAMVLVEQAKHAAAQPYAEEALAVRRVALGEDHPDTVRATYLLVDVLRWRNKLDRAEELIRNVYDRQRRALGENDPRTLESLFRLGRVIFYREDNRFYEAARLIEASAPRLRAALGDDDEITITAIQTLGTIRAWQGRLDESAALLGDVLQIMHRQLGDDNWLTWNTADTLGEALYEQGRVAEAEPLIEDGLKGLRRIRGWDEHHALGALEDLAKLRLLQGRLAEAEASIRETREGCGWTPRLEFLLARILDRAGDPEKSAEADDLRRTCIDTYIAKYGAQDLRTFGMLDGAAWNLYLSGRAEDGEPWARQAVEGFRAPALAVDHGRDTGMMDALNTLATILRDTGRPEEALPLFEEIRRTRGAAGGVKHRLAVETWVRHAECLSMLGRNTDAERELVECTRALSDAGYPTIPFQVIKAIIRFYDGWNTAEPGMGHGAQAAEWRRRLPCFPGQVDPPPAGG